MRLVYLLFTLPLAATTFRVPTGYASIQTAINVASDGDEILVDAGTYPETLFLGSKTVRIQATSGALATMIAARGTGAAITITGGSAAIIGFTIQGGGSVSMPDEGGGILIAGGSPTIEDNTIRLNKASYGGGGIAVLAGSPVIRNNIIRENSTGASGGGGITVHGAGSPLITNNLIRENVSTGGGSGITLYVVSTPTVRSNVIQGNRGGDAGGIVIYGGGNALIQQNLIVGNVGRVGGILNPQATIVNNTIADNEGRDASAMSGNYAPGGLIVNNVLTSKGGTLMACTTLLDAFRSNLMFPGAGGVLSAGGSCPLPDSSSLNAVADPLYVCPGDYHLRSGSPGIDSGDISAAAFTQDLDYGPRMAGSAIDRGAYEFAGPSQLQFNPSNVTFDDVVIGGLALPKSITVTNTSARRAAFCSQTSGSEFQLSSACGSGLDAGQSCTIGVNFRPAADGVRTGSLSVLTNASTPASVGLRGIGLNPVAGLDSISPLSAIAGGASFTLEVRGSGFTETSVVQWNGNSRQTTYVNSALLRAGIPASDIAGPGHGEIRVVNPSPGGGTSTIRVLPVLAPTITDGALRNGANYSLRLAAGSYVALFGSNLTAAALSASSVPLPTSLAGVSVSLNGFAAPLFYVSPTQINLQIPWELLNATTANLVLTVNGVPSAPVRVQLSPLAPSLLSLNAQGTGQAAVLLAGTGIVADRTHPANRTNVVEIYALGLGAVAGAPATGAPARGVSPTAVEVTAEFGGVPAKVLFAGLAPGFVGLYQVNVQLPLNAPTGIDVPVVIKQGGQVSNALTMGIQ